MLAMDMTLDVSHVPICWLYLVAFENIDVMLVTFDVSQMPIG